jgi:hypothetical protein
MPCQEASWARKPNVGADAVDVALTCIIDVNAGCCDDAVDEVSGTWTQNSNGKSIKVT